MTRMSRPYAPLWGFLFLGIIPAVVLCSAPLDCADAAFGDNPQSSIVNPQSSQSPIVSYPPDHPGTIFKLPYDHLDWIETGPGLTCLQAHNTQVALWWASWYDMGEEARVEKPWGDEIYRFRADQRERILHGVNALSSIGVKSIVYLHTWNLKQAGYTIEQIVAWSRDLKVRWGFRGLYLDGVIFGDALETQRLFKALRGVFPEGVGIIYLHDSIGARLAWGHPRAIELVDYCLIGEGPDPPRTEEALNHTLKGPGPSRSFVLDLSDIPEDLERELACWCGRNGVALTWAKGQLFKWVRCYEDCLPGATGGLPASALPIGV